ncbi:MAG: hypothetical protein K6G15_00355, partial [Desulfovibrio sp.]|nr:hypothetical protein [Desulfovibrio sp.]
ANRMRSLRPFLEIWPAPMGELAFLTQCLASQSSLYEQLEPEQDTEDYPSFPGKDPQSEQVLSDVAIYLENHKEMDLAQQLLQALESSAVSVPYQVLQLYNAAQQAVKQQKWEKLSELAAQFTGLMQSDCYDAHEQCLFYKQFLSILSPVEPVRGLYHKLLQELVAIADEQVDKYLFLATEYAKHAMYEESYKHFTHALDLSEVEYLQNRPDVGQAIACNAFCSGLQHFVLHGRKESSAWPYARAFAKNLVVLGELARFDQSFSKTYGLSFTLLLPIFQPTPIKGM